MNEWFGFTVGVFFQVWGRGRKNFWSNARAISMCYACVKARSHQSCHPLLPAGGVCA